MDISPIQTPVKASDIPLGQLAGNKSVSDEEKIGETARQFEAILLRQILQETRKTVIQSNVAGANSAVSGIYGDMINNQMADTISRSGTVGLAASLKAQLVHQVLPHDNAPTAAPNAFGASASQPQPRAAARK